MPHPDCSLPPYQASLLQAGASSLEKVAGRQPSSALTTPPHPLQLSSQGECSGQGQERFVELCWGVSGFLSAGPPLWSPPEGHSWQLLFAMSCSLLLPSDQEFSQPGPASPPVSCPSGLSPDSYPDSPWWEWPWTPTALCRTVKAKPRLHSLARGILCPEPVVTQLQAFQGLPIRLRTPPRAHKVPGSCPPL